MSTTNDTKMWGWMRLRTPRCPVCDKLAEGTIDQVPGVARFTSTHDDGSVDWAGDTELDYDGQEQRHDADGAVRVLCEDGHDWYTHIDYQDGTSTELVASTLARAAFAGVEVTVSRAQADGTLLVQIDTEDVDENDEGPLMRVYVNDGAVYENPVLPGVEREASSPAPAPRYSVLASESVDVPGDPTTFFVMDEVIDDAMVFHDTKAEADADAAARNVKTLDALCELKAAIEAMAHMTTEVFVEFERARGGWLLPDDAYAQLREARDRWTRASQAAIDGLR